MELRIWHIPQVPMRAFRVRVSDIDSACLLLEVLAKYDSFQYENKIKPDYANASGLEVYDEILSEWTDWYGEDDGEDIWTYIDNVWRPKHENLFLEVLPDGTLEG